MYIPYEKRRTVCLSSQVGCPLKCKFCATGTIGFKRNLETWEILDQLLSVKKALIEVDPSFKGITNVVFMGMGEPFLNWERVRDALHLIRSPIAFGIGARHITISTVGIVPGIYYLAEERRQFKLAVSLHTAIQQKREELVPIAREYPIRELKRACFYYQMKKGKRITFEVVHIPGITDTDEDVRALLRFIDGLMAKVNVIPFNPVDGLPYRAPREDETEAFLKKLRKLPVPVTLRRSKGRDVSGACGQLALKRSPFFKKIDNIP